jgi:large subunit ribosomal protein L23
MKQIVKKPLITEKNTYQNAMGIYVFEVDQKASKIEIKKFVEKMFKVRVASVNTSLTRGQAKVTKFGVGKVVKAKKAFVKLAAGEKIALFDGV